MEPGDLFEEEARWRGYRVVAGLDEAGRGPLAGPVVAAAVILPRQCRMPGLNDSKVVPVADRERLYGIILERAVGVAVGVASAEEIDAHNILEATRLAMRRAVRDLVPQPDCLLIDALTLPSVDLFQRPIVKGDKISVSIAAASIIAKVHRDRVMTELHEIYPQYNFRGHKGYPTEEHRRLLRRHGPCPIHRHTFGPVEDCAAPTSLAAKKHPAQTDLLLDPMTLNGLGSDRW